MNERIEDRLDAEIDAALNGAARQHEGLTAGEPLSELGQFAAGLQKQIAVPLPTEAGSRRGRQRLMAEVDAVQRLPRLGAATLLGSQLKRFKQWQAPAPFARRMAAVATLLVAGFAFSGTLAASADSLPGDPLYDLKRIQEQVWLSVTIDNEARDRLQEQIDSTRVTELNAVLRLMRAVRTEVSGTVRAKDGDILVVDQVSLTVDHTQFPAVATVVVGDRLRLVVQTFSDGSVKVIDFKQEQREISGLDPAGRASKPATGTQDISHPGIAKTGTSRPPAGAATDGEPAAQQAATRVGSSVTATTTPLPSATAQPSSTPQAPPAHAEPKPATPSPSSTGIPPEQHRAPAATKGPSATYTPRPTRTREPTETPEATESPEATETRRPAATERPVRTPRPTETRTDEQAASTVLTPPKGMDDPARIAAAQPPLPTLAKRPNSP